MADRDQILADFMAFTGAEDFEHSLAVLEQHDWNLMEAVQNTMAGMDSPHPQPEPKPDEALPTYEEVSPGYEPLVDHSVGSVGTNVNRFEPLGEGILGRRIVTGVPPGGARFESDSAEGDDAGAAAAPPESAFSSFTGGSSTNYASAIGFASTSTDFTRIRLLNFKIEYRDRSLNLTVPDNETVDKVKELIQIETMIPKDKQQLCGWVSRHDNTVGDQMVLRELKLPKENVLYLSTSHVHTEGTANGESPEVTGRLAATFQLLVKHKDKVYPLKFPGAKTIKEVKSDVYSIIDVPVRHQVWSGWPLSATTDDNMRLADSAVTFPCHNLEVTSTANTENKPTYGVVDISSDEEFEDAAYAMDEDVLFEGEGAGVIISKQAPLMPENSRNEGEALEAFVKEFSNRYGENHPVFYIGNLEDALKDSLQCKARERKLLAVYLHHDNSIQANVFCSQLLCSDAVIDYLSAHFLLWAWDLTTEANKARLLSMCTRHFGSVAANTVRSFKPDELPLLLIISRNRSTNEVMQVIRGNTSIDELLQQLMHCEEVFRQQLVSDIDEEDQRDAREAIKSEQERAYETSLNADRAKEEARRQQEEEDMHLHLQMEEIQKREQEKKRVEEDEKEALRLAVANKLPDEPPKECSELVSTIRFRCPGGEIITRRFLAQHPLQVLLNFVLSKGYHLEEYKILSTFPRRDVTQEDPSKSLEDCKLYPQETLVLEERS